mgnify:CR=1 FL=1
MSAANLIEFLLPPTTRLSDGISYPVGDKYFPWKFNLLAARAIDGEFHRRDRSLMAGKYWIRTNN